MITNAITTYADFYLTLQAHTVDTLKTLIESQPNLLNQVDEKGRTLLYCAYHSRHYDITAMLLDFGAIDKPMTPKVYPRSRFTFPREHILHHIIKHTQLDLLKRLIPNHLNLLEKKDFSGKTPLLLAIHCDFVPGIQYLISMGANVNATAEIEIKIETLFGTTITRIEKTALHSAYQPGRYGIIKQLIQAGAIDTACNGEFVFHKLIKDGQLELVQLLLEKQPALLNQVDKHSNPPIMLALYEGWNDVADFLKTQVEKDSPPFEPSPNLTYISDIAESLPDIHNTRAKYNFFMTKFPTTFSQSPINLFDKSYLHAAAIYGQNELIQSILETNPSLLNQRNTEGYTPLALAAIFGNTTTVEDLTSRKGIDLNLKSPLLTGKTAVDWAYLMNNHLTILPLVEADADINLSKTNGQRQLYLCANSGCVEAVERKIDQLHNNQDLSLTEKNAIFSQAMQKLLDTERFSEQSIDDLKAIAKKHGYKHLHAYLQFKDSNNPIFFPLSISTRTPSAPAMHHPDINSSSGANLSLQQSNNPQQQPKKNLVFDKSSSISQYFDYLGTLFNPVVNNENTTHQLDRSTSREFT